MAESNLNILLKEPSYYHREYSNDTESPRNPSWSDQTNCEKAQRVLNVALPFITLYKPLSFPVSLGMGAMRTVSRISQLVICIKDGKDTETTAYQTLQTAIAIISLAGTILAHPLGMLITTAQDLVIDVTKLVEHMKNGDYKKALECCGNILNNTLYFALFLNGGLELSIASLGVQILIGIYHSQEEFKKGNFLEAAGHLGIALIRGNQMKNQISILNHKWKMELLIKSQENQELYANNEMKWPALHYAIQKNDKKAVIEILQNHPEQLKQRTPNIPVWKHLHGAFWDSELVADGHRCVGFVQGYEPLELAMLQGDTSIMELLLERGADPSSQRTLNAGTISGQEPGKWITLQNPKGSYKDGDKVWGMEGFPVRYSEKITPLYQAIRMHRPDLVKILLNHSINLNNCYTLCFPDANPQSALQVAHTYLSPFKWVDPAEIKKRQEIYEMIALAMKKQFDSAERSELASIAARSSLEEAL
jgi:hypothetical protein